VLKDHTGKIRISRFSRGVATAIAAGRNSKSADTQLVLWLQDRIGEESKYGLTLEDPELEVLAHPGDTIDSLNIGRVVPVYSLRVGADMVRQAVIASLPAVNSKTLCQLPYTSMG